jgi:hypothetical protein
MCAFIKGRVIYGNFMLVQQLAKSFHASNSKSSTLLLALDIVMAFDSLMAVHHRVA